MCWWRLAPLVLAMGLTLGDYVGQSARGVVGEGNYTYFSLRKTGNVVLRLISETGDADLYISSETERPSYMLEEHYMHSTTCGEDRITVPPDLPRPINIAVYGHPRYPLSEFVLEVIIVETEEEEVDYFMSDEARAESERLKGEDSRFESEKSSYKFLWSVLWQILEIILDVII